MQQDLSFNGSLDPDEWRGWAREWREAGRFEDALRAHEWYHAHVLELDDASYGVRLSYALWEWVRLAREYGPARESLARIRSQAAAAALERPSDGEAFHEALAIDWALDDESAAYNLIVRVEAIHGDALDKYYNNEVFRVLLGRREYGRCLRWMRDPAQQLDLAAESLEFQSSSSLPGLDPERAIGRFIDRAIDLAVVLLGAGDANGADEIVRRAGRYVDHPRLSGALDEARRILLDRPPFSAGDAPA